jgi:hypothetical protein
MVINGRIVGDVVPCTGVIVMERNEDFRTRPHSELGTVRKCDARILVAREDHDGAGCAKIPPERKGNPQINICLYCVTRRTSARTVFSPVSGVEKDSPALQKGAVDLYDGISFGWRIPLSGGDIVDRSTAGTQQKCKESENPEERTGCVLHVSVDGYSF